MSEGIDATISFGGLPDGPEREAARRAAYQALFGTAIGRMVLRDVLAEAGVGKLMGPASVNREYEAGAHDLALKIMDLADVSQAVLHTTLMNGEEGYFDERADY